MPSKSRGLRTSTGCLTCRKRRVKCDETLPRCRNCDRVGRDCAYPEKPTVPQRSRTLSAREASEVPAKPTVAHPSASLTSHVNNSDIISRPEPENAVIDPAPSYPSFSLAPREVPVNTLLDDNFFLNDNLFAFDDSLTPNLGPVEWYDLLAEDAINSMQGQSSRWDFDITTLSRRQSPRQSVAPETVGTSFDGQEAQPLPVLHKHWNTESALELTQDEAVYYRHFINVVAPVLDLFDHERHFANIVPHLALRNVGLLKSILAVGACHMTIVHHPSELGEAASFLPGTPASGASATTNTRRIAGQYYYETLQYLSQHLLYQAYTTSHELLSTAVMISIYEMFSTVNDSNHSNWDRHLRGAFWIQKNSGVSGESADSLHRAIWWAWLRQDVWAAFRTGRPTLTIHQPRTPISALTPDGLATRIIYIAAKCVQFAATPKEGDIAAYIEAGETLMRMLDLWKRSLPASFEPIGIAPSTMDSDQISPIWIHPPAHAAAIQMYHFARIIMILNQPSTGGLSTYQTRFKQMRESTMTTCGIAIAQQSQNLPSAIVSFQAVYAAALCAETQDRQSEVLDVLDKVLSISKFPSRSILDDLVSVWNNAK
ncbi:hypothetical protein HBI04_172190 [Parastagonospora nodorum]|nr:hypothetical protein HBI03_177180 [Parastagonospora nodorum]KAH4266638.1 hypothetical protein HBI04_172190 [Parastagonospora nodorum]KAH5303479.1 hypothetical protein HBI50_191190 [Parastagonospora nodorum]